jgi:ABC-type spermidine/putrescine transport system permease subunit I
VGASRRPLPGLLLLPSAVLLLVFLVLPLCATVWLSLEPNALVRFEGRGAGNYAYLAGRAYYLGVVARTFRLAAESTGIALLLGYPAALAMRAESERVAGTLSLLMTLPVLAGPLVVVLGWMILLSNGGPILGPLVRWGWIERVRWLGTETGILVGVVHFVLPFVVLSLASVVRSLPRPLLEAAQSLGAGPLTRFRLVVFPLALPGLVSAAVIAFSLSMSSFVAPHYLGGPADLTLTTLISQFVLATFNGQLAAAAATVLLVLMTVVIGAVTVGAARAVRA